MSSGKVSESEETLVRALLESPDNAELRARMASRKLMNGYIDEAQTLLDETPLGIDHTLLHVIEGRLHLARADRQRDGTGQTDQALLSKPLLHSMMHYDLTGNQELLGLDWPEQNVSWAT